jgi:predicted metal-dependent HD superfamily phosphohydrolase
MPAGTISLKARWARLVGAGAEAVPVGNDLLARWAEPHRRYHDIRHLDAVLTHLDHLGSTSRPVHLGAWYHDAVYQPGAQDNEEASASLARSGLTAIGLEAGVVDEVMRLVRLTASHQAGSEDAEGAHLCDADLAVLGSGPAAYESYRGAVRAEYAAVDEDSWRIGRRQVLEQFLDREHIFATDMGRRLWEESARANLTGELDALQD